MDKIPESSKTRPTTVVIVDDSPFFRYQLGTRLNRRGWRVAASLTSGEDAVQKIPEINPQLVLMDVVMPGMDGMDTVRELRKTWNGPIVMMSAHSDQGIRNTWKALDAGANDFVAKPGAREDVDHMINQIVERLKMVGRGAVRLNDRPAQAPVEVRTTGIRLLVIGASTGGPKALSHLFQTLGKPPTIPVLIVQHMPGNFTRSFAERLTGLLGSPVIEAPPDGSSIALQGAPVVVAAGGRHLRVSANACWSEIGERRHGVIPSVDITLFDALEAFGEQLATVILTGMGEDGAEGARQLKRRGGTVVVESQDTALVWGMPGAVAKNGDADAIWPLDRIGVWIKKVSTRG